MHTHAETDVKPNEASGIILNSDARELEVYSTISFGDVIHYSDGYTTTISSWRSRT